MWLTAIVVRTASPSAPPTCCEVLKRPDASPWSSSFRPVVAMSVSGMKIAPMPSDARIIPGRTSDAYEPSTGIREKSSSPTIVSTMPTTVTGRTPIRGAKAEASPAESMIPAVNGRNATPAFSGPKPSALLDVQRVEEEHREHPREGEEHREVRGRERADAEDREPDERLRRALLDQDEADEEHGRERRRRRSTTSSSSRAAAEWTSPNTSSISPPVTETAPARS